MSPDKLRAALLHLEAEWSPEARAAVEALFDTLARENERLVAIDKLRVDEYNSLLLAGTRQDERIATLTRERDEAQAELKRSISNEARLMARDIVAIGTVHLLQTKTDDETERLFWEFDARRKQTGAERDAFKAAIREVIAVVANGEALAQARRAVPEGWKLVPGSATEAMRMAWYRKWSEIGGCAWQWASAYSAMLAAAPQPPAQEGKDK